MEFTHKWFEESSNAWMLNKKRLKDGTYKYICSYDKCKKNVYNFDTLMCKNHSNKHQLSHNS